MRSSVSLALETCPVFIQGRECRACGEHTNLVVTAVGKGHSFPSCATYECQEVVKNKILAALAAERKPLLARIFRHA